MRTLEELTRIHLSTNQDRAEYITLELPEYIDYSECPLDLQGFLQWFQNNRLLNVLETKVRLMESQNPHCNCGICTSTVPCTELIRYPALNTDICEQCFINLKQEDERNNR